MNEQIQQGPNLEYKPSLGGNVAGPVRPSESGLANTYANINDLQSQLRKLFQNCDYLITQFQSDLSSLALEITSDPSDYDLRDAQTAIFPEKTVDINFVTYRYYDLLDSVDSAASKYIQRKYEIASRDVNGDNALELMTLVKIIQKEGLLIDDFLNQYIGGVNDSSERRVLELFQDWVSTALGHTGRILSIHKKKNSTVEFNEKDIQSVDQGEASNTQALFKIKMNSVNEEISSEINILKRNFSEYSNVFYEKFMGPLLKTRLIATKSIYPRSGLMGTEIGTIKSITENHLESILTDQLRRQKIFDDKLNIITNLIQKRDTYRGYIKQLAPVGKRPRNTGSGVLVNINEPNTLPYEPLYDKIITKTNTTTSKFQAKHTDLIDRDSTEAHPQYILKDGDEITGEIAMGDQSKIGGMHLPSHAHTGSDGSAPISGRDILPGSLPINAIDQDQKPQRPTNIQISRQQTRVITDGVNIWDIDLIFDGVDDSQFEINIAVIE